MTDALKLASSVCSYVEAPAGYGKSRLIADAVLGCTEGKQLILTHTHAGVNALRKHLKDVGVGAKQFEIDTIAGWALRFCQAYPATSGISSNIKMREIDWDSVYRGALAVFQSPVKAVLVQSYRGIYVDEYQDCTFEQHTLIAECAKVLPCRVVGDLMQGIFSFGKTKLVTSTDIVDTFEALPALTTAWRWKEAEELGRWLTTAREILQNSGELDLRSDLPECISWVPLPEAGTFDVQRDACQKLLNRTPTKHQVVAIYAPEEFHKERMMAAALWGQYDVVEPINCGELYSAAEALDKGSGNERALVLMEFAEKALTKISTSLKKTKNALAKNKPLEKSTADYPKQLAALQQLREKNDWDSVENVLLSFEQVSGARRKRRELFEEMVRALREVSRGDAESLEAAVFAIRSRTSRFGRQSRRCTLGRTVLVKGLQFDHAILVDADTLNTKNLYVALTRASRTVTILSREGLLRPSQNDKFH